MPTFDEKSAPPISAARAPAFAPRPPALPNPRGLRRNQRRVIQVIQQRRLQYLGHCQRPLHHRERHVRMHHPPLRHRAQRNPLEVPVRAQPVQKILIEQRRAALPLLPAKQRDILPTKARPAHPVHKPFQPGIDAISRAMRPVVRITPKKIVELRLLLMQARAEVKLRHRQLVFVREQYPFSRRPI